MKRSITGNRRITLCTAAASRHGNTGPRSPPVDSDRMSRIWWICVYVVFRCIIVGRRPLNGIGVGDVVVCVAHVFLNLRAGIYVFCVLLCSPEFGLRSYLYVALHAVVGKLLGGVFALDKVRVWLHYFLGVHSCVCVCVLILRVFVLCVVSLCNLDLPCAQYSVWAHVFLCILAVHCSSAQRMCMYVCIAIVRVCELMLFSTGV